MIKTLLHRRKAGSDVQTLRNHACDHSVTQRCREYSTCLSRALGNNFQKADERCLVLESWGPGQSTLFRPKKAEGILPEGTWTSRRPGT
ncbi:hypothetical protein M8818_000519 [Zalaria obscura]|uniref:Uncharacterized protein n=1 Tax=Zalaria obscura TaxID=2024903 RepID=A0ACC3SN46_9PEZI